jgi:hypothetical protein
MGRRGVVTRISDGVDFEEVQTRVQGVLKRVDAGEVALIVLEDQGDVIHYATADGWRFVVFIDAGEWDYFEGIITPEGESFDYDGVQAHLPGLIWYEPTNRHAWGVL